MLEESYPNFPPAYIIAAIELLCVTVRQQHSLYAPFSAHCFYQ